jgi:beta-lactam-binding protein with PASTA domain/predicted Ser/Thr protein kinase
MNMEPPNDNSGFGRGVTMVGNGRYELTSMLGRGGMAEVRRGRDLRLGRTVAVKRLRADLASDPTFQARFRREAQSAASLNHPTIVAVYDTGEETASDGSGVSLPYIVMEYVEGRTLRDILREGRKILPERALEIMSSVLNALDYSHRAGIVHRDIKPANVMLTPTGDVKVMDFGIARAIADASATMTQTSAVVGTAQYLSPEQARGEQVDARSDLYSAGCLLYELLTGRPPFVGDSPVSVAYQHVREEAPPPSSLDPEITPEIDAITMKALAKRVEQRYQSAAEMRTDIERALAGHAVLAPPVAGEGQATEHFLPPAPLDDPQTATAAAPVRHDDEPTRRRTGAYVVLGLLIAALFVAAAIFIPRLLGSEETAQTTVPRLTGMTLAQARAEISKAQLDFGTSEIQFSTSVPKNRVMSQSVAAGQTVDVDTEIDLVVSGGAETRVVVDVSDMTLQQATETLTGLGFNVVPEEDPTSTERRNQVTRTDPPPGTQLRVGEEVTVFYSPGFVQVPSVVGLTEQKARKALEDVGFNVVVSDDAESQAPKGTVTEQDPSAGTRQPFGTFITIRVSIGPPATTPPTTTPPTTTTAPTTTAPTTTTVQTLLSP